MTLIFSFIHHDLRTYYLTEMVDLTSRICWELVSKEGYIAIWRKPINNSCYLSRDIAVRPPLCDINDEPDDVWYVSQHIV